MTAIVQDSLNNNSKLGYVNKETKIEDDQPFISFIYTFLCVFSENDPVSGS